MLKEVIAQKGLNLKEVDGQLRGSVEAKFVVAHSYSPDELKLKKINAMSLEPQTEDSCIAPRLRAADSEIDRGFEKFLPAALEGLAKRYPDKPVLKDHDWTVDSIVGKVFDATVEGGELLLDAFFPKTTKNLPIVENILNGIYSKLSVGFAASPEDMVCSACGHSMFDATCPHQPGQTLKDGSTVILLYKDVTDVFEVSIVACPMQPAAKILNSKEYNDPIFIAGGIASIPSVLSVSDIIPISEDAPAPIEVEKHSAEIIPTDRIIVDGTDTIKDSSLNMDPENQDLTTPAAEIPPVEAPAEAPANVETKDFPSQEEAQEGESLHSKIDNLHQVHAETKSLCGNMNDKLDAINEKCMSTLSAIKAVPAPAAPVSLEALEAKMTAIEETLKALQKTLDVNVQLSTAGVQKLLSVENVKTQESATKKKLWALDYFGNTKDDLGGQQ